MSFFISYSRRDERAVQVLATDLERTRRSMWMDRELGGGEDWWLEILSQIRQAKVFVLAVSTNSLRSRPCLAELEYARSLGLPVLPVQVGDVESFRMTPIAEKQVLDYRGRIATRRDDRALAEPAIDLVVAATGLEAQREPLPDPLPAAPPIPFEYLMQLRLAIDAEEMPSRLQLAVLTQLKQALRDEEDADARRDVIDLMQRMRRHPDTTYRNATEIEDILAEVGTAPFAPPAEDGGNGSSSSATEKPEPATEPAHAAEQHLAEPAEPAEERGTAWPEPGRRTSPWTVAVPLGIGLGAFGIGQYPPLFVYSLGTIFRFDPATTPAQVLGWLTISMILCLLGVGLGVYAVRHRMYGAAWSLTASALGSVVIASVISWYRQWW